MICRRISPDGRMVEDPWVAAKVHRRSGRRASTPRRWCGHVRRRVRSVAGLHGVGVPLVTRGAKPVSPVGPTSRGLCGALHRAIWTPIHEIDPECSRTSRTGCRTDDRLPAVRYPPTRRAPWSNHHRRHRRTNAETACRAAQCVTRVTMCRPEVVTGTGDWCGSVVRTAASAAGYDLKVLMVGSRGHPE